MINSKTYPAIIHATLALNASTAAPFYDVNIQQRLCHCACVDERPIFKPAFSVLAVEPVGQNQYLIYLQVEGVASYVPCGCGSCSTKSQVIAQGFTIPVYSTANITGATVAAGQTQNMIVRTSCKSCSNVMESDTPITLTFITA